MMALLDLWRTYGSVINGGILLSIFTLILNIWIKSRRVAIEEKANDREGYGDLIDRLEKRAADVETKLTTAETRIEGMREELSTANTQMGNLRAHLSQALSGIRLLMDALEAKDPADPILRRVRMLLAATFRDLEAPCLPKSETLKAAEETRHAAAVTVETVKRDEAEQAK